MNIIYLIIIGLACGLVSQRISKIRQKGQEISAYLRKRDNSALIDMILGVTGALAGHLLISGRAYISEVNLIEIVFATLGGLAIIWIGRNVTWFRVV